MKFAEHLGAHITPEWHKQYIQYEPLKEMLYAAQEEAPNPEAVDDDHVQRFLASFEERFFLTCDKELAKINTFYSEKLAEAQRRFANLKNELGAIEERDRQQQTVRHRKLPSVVHKDKEKQVTVRNVHNMKLAFSEFYLSLILLQNYQQLNFTGFRKILKKHDKLMQTCKGAEWRSAHVESAPFYTNKDIDRLIIDTENVFTTKLEGGNRQKAMKRLRVPPLEAQETPWTTFRVGLFSGIFIVLLISFILSAIFVDVPTEWRPVLRMYRGIFLLVLFLFLLGVNTYGWRSSGVNHVLIFELDPRDNLNHQQLLELSGFFAVIFCLSILSSLYGDLLHISSMLQPLILVGFCIVFVVNPFKICYYTSRMWLLRLIGRISTAPFHHVGFADFWLADQLNSLVMVFYDFEYLVCFYAFRMDWSSLSLKGDFTEDNDMCMSNIYGIRPVLGCLPAWWRFSQCLRRYRDTRLAFPHLVNAGKYATTFFMVIFHSLHVWQKSKSDNEICFYLWIAASIVSSCYTLAWDLKMDWGLFDKNAGENRFLREEIVYAYKAYYYFAVIEDTILRFAWTLTVTLAEQNIIDPDVLTSILAALEVIRRYIWNYFRLENEHLNNCGQFRAVRDISIAPIATNDLALLQQMMDDLEGVTHRRKNRLKNKQHLAQYIRRYTVSTTDRPSKLRKSETRLRLLGSSET